MNRLHQAFCLLRLKLLESYKLIFKTKVPDNKKENIYLLTEKGIELTPIIIEFTLWGDKWMREFNQIDTIDGLKANKSIIIKTTQDNYKNLAVEYR